MGFSAQVREAGDAQPRLAKRVQGGVAQYFFESCRWA